MSKYYVKLISNATIITTIVAQWNEIISSYTGTAVALVIEECKNQYACTCTDVIFCGYIFKKLIAAYTSSVLLGV